ncbi:hypothetical protein GLAREA_10399 [Glarea lozoyensis ATCC 20868]|uniref:Uncharacterized protein n=1 Tax=Glarea lozoyensis (strain ATCC 20868 / MF5171) TaxID=1116229 RepID=S3DAG3_GLAL2|nr:uncharacterized protein GLAREA_10399 [Glarea lozoyensis ATCC 20868]EPE34705.1 hypothetical protein GLAREA_10399 [Glarea lozoyensis ATCC 20868]
MELGIQFHAKVSNLGEISIKSKSFGGMVLQVVHILCVPGLHEAEMFSVGTGTRGSASSVQDTLTSTLASIRHISTIKYSTHQKTKAHKAGLSSFWSHLSRITSVMSFRVLLMRRCHSTCSVDPSGFAGQQERTSYITYIQEDSPFCQIMDFESRSRIALELLEDELGIKITHTDANKALGDSSRMYHPTNKLYRLNHNKAAQKCIKQLSITVKYNSPSAIYADVKENQVIHLGFRHDQATLEPARPLQHERIPSNDAATLSRHITLMFKQILPLPRHGCSKVRRAPDVGRTGDFRCQVCTHEAALRHRLTDTSSSVFEQFNP